MRATPSHLNAGRLRRHLGWLLALALLFPVAQSVASWHAVSHLSATLAGDGEADAKALHASACALCLNAAALGDGPLPSQPPGLVLGTARYAPPMAAAVSTPGDAVWLAYQSRAPPSFISC